MSRNLHVASCYKIKYEDVPVYSKQEEEFCNLLFNHCETAWWEDDGIGDRVEVEKDDIKRLIKEIKDDPKIIERYDLGMTSDELIATLEKIVAKAEPEDDIIHLEWF